jgi:hypothetical protein
VGSNPTLTAERRHSRQESGWSVVSNIGANHVRTSKDRKQPKLSYAILNRLTFNPFALSYIR